MSNKVKYGLEQVHIAFVDDEAEGVDWKEPEHIEGAVNFSASPEGDETEFYADNRLYYYDETNDGYTGDLELANIPDEIISEMLGNEIDDNGMVVETTEDTAKEFALMAEMKGDERDRRFVYYRCKAGRPDNEAATTEGSIDPQTDSVPLTMMPIDTDEKDGLVRAVIEKDEDNEEIYESFFGKVVLPNEEVEA